MVSAPRVSRAEAFSRALQQTIAQGDEGVRVVIDGWRRALKNRWRRRAAVMLDHLPLLLIDADAATARQLAALARTTLAAIPANDHATVERAVEAFINALMASPAQIAVMAPVIRQYRVRLSRAEALGLSTRSPRPRMISVRSAPRAAPA